MAELRKFNEWRYYRGEPQLLKNEWEQQWRKKPFTLTDAQKLANDQPLKRALKQPVSVTIPMMNIPFEQYDPDDAAFLARDFKKLPRLPGEQWQGVKILGQGGYGRVGMWERVNAPAGTALTRAAVKEIKPGVVPVANDPNDLEYEGYIMELFMQAPGPHIVQQICRPVKLTAAAVQNAGLGDFWIGVTQRLYMEYCSLGSLHILLKQRMERQIPFSEATLWQFFECLIDGAIAMEYGGHEALIRNDIISINGSLKKNGVVHFDLKLENIFLADRDANHTKTPIAKVGDFGLAIQTDSLSDRQAAGYNKMMEDLRRRGTQTYYSPEQFSKRWDFDGWENDPMIGNYGSKTNIWGMALLMWQLAVFTNDRIDPSKPFLPTFELSGAPAKGVTYGLDLQACNYSDELKGLIFECLYEDPRLRPSLMDLRMSIKTGLDKAIAAGSNVDNWADFLPPEPPNALPSPPPSPPEVNAAAARQAEVTILPPLTLVNVTCQFLYKMGPR